MDTSHLVMQNITEMCIQGQRFNKTSNFIVYKDILNETSFLKKLPVSVKNTMNITPVWGLLWI